MPFPSLEELRKEALKCTRCKLATTRKHVVFGEGREDAPLMFIGEGPGRVEDETGRPFVGRAGQLLRELIKEVLEISPEETYITNIVKCRPTIDMLGEKDRPPEKEEVEACSFFLYGQIEKISPKVIVTLGAPASRFLLKTTEGIRKIRGKWHSYKNIPVMPTYHPSYILRSGGKLSLSYKEITRDFLEVKKRLNSLDDNISPPKGQIELFS